MRAINVCIFLVLCFLANGCGGIAYRSPTAAMNPTITSDDLCVANPFAYSFGEIDRFDLVVFSPNEEQKQRFKDNDLKYLMRIIGLPNEKVEIKDSQVFINDKLLVEPFDKIKSEGDLRKDFAPIILPGDEFFVLGDNRPDSEDSRYWKKSTIKKENILSKIVDIKRDFYKVN